MMELGLKGKVAIITGGSDGLGRAAALRLAEEGACVAIGARRREHLEAAGAEIQAATRAEVMAVPTDVTVTAECERLVAMALSRWGRVDILLNNAGTSAASPFAKVSDEMWQADWDLKLMGAVRMARLVVPGMRSRRDGRIVNVTTVGGKAPTAGALPTSVTRAAGINLTKAMANEYAVDNVRVNTICIGLVRTPQITAKDTGGDVEKYYAGLARSRVPLGRVADAEEFADLFAFLVSDRARDITGTAVNFDGGSGMTV